MIVIIGGVVVLGAVLTGFMMAGGHIGALIHPSEFITIGGAAFGALILMSPKKVLGDMMRGVVQTVKGTPYDKKGYEELFKLLYEFLRLARRDGYLALEPHVSDPHGSKLFGKYAGVSKNHHVIEFICGALWPMVDGTATPDRLPALMQAELKALEEEHHAPLGVLSKTADSLPGFGIVAAVMGVVITMGAIDGPVEEIGHKVGAALVGTFLGILLCYGFVGPLATRMEFLGTSEISYFKAAASVIQGFVEGLPPKVAVEQARRGLPGEVRPTRERLEELFSEAESS